jgi:hypothetical protein
MRTYEAQFELGGAVIGQFEFDCTVIVGVELPSGGIVTGRLTPAPTLIVCCADTATSIVAGVLPVVAGTKPWNVPQL